MRFLIFCNLIIFSLLNTSGAAAKDARLPLGYGASVSAGIFSCGNVKKKAAFMHPPWQGTSGSVIVTYKLDLPKKKRITLKMYVGLQEKAPSENGVAFKVSVNGKQLANIMVPTLKAWRLCGVDLSKYAGKRVKLEFCVDSLGNAGGDWAVIGEPRIIAGNRTIVDLIKKAFLAKTEITLEPESGD